MSTPEQDDDDKDTLNVEFELGPKHRRWFFERPTDNEGAYHDDVKATLYLGGRAIGEITGTLLRGGLIVNDRLNLFQEMDNISHELLRVAEAVIDIDRNYYTEDFWSKAEPEGLNILVLERLTIDEGFRGHDLGLGLMQHLLRYCAHDVALLKPFPLQHEHSHTGPRPEFAAFQSIPEKKATAKLRKHYKRLGFEHLAGSELMFRSTAHRRKYLRFDLEPDVMASLAQKARDLPERSLHDEDSARSRGSLEH